MQILEDLLGGRTALWVWIHLDPNHSRSSRTHMEGDIYLPNMTLNDLYARVVQHEAASRSESDKFGLPVFD